LIEAFKRVTNPSERSHHYRYRGGSRLRGLGWRHRGVCGPYGFRLNELLKT
jgi:hypothetical protein